MNTDLEFYLLLGIGLWLIGLYGVWRNRTLIRRIICINIMGSGVFLLMVSLARRSADTDPVLHALVVTGLVVAVSATAFALRLACACNNEQHH